MLGLNIDEGKLLLSKLTICDTINLIKINKLYYELNSQDWIWETRMVLDYPQYTNHRNLPKETALEQYKYITEHRGEVFIVMYSSYRCYYDNIQDAYSKFITQLMNIGNLSDYNLSDLPRYRVPQYNGFIAIYWSKFPEDIELVSVSDRGAGLSYPEFLQLPPTLSAPYYKYKWTTSYSPTSSHCDDSSNPVFNLGEDSEIFDTKGSEYTYYFETNSGVFKRDYPEF